MYFYETTFLIFNDFKLIYFYSTLFFLIFLTTSSYGQEVKQQGKINTEGTIDGLSFYPNPVSNGKIYITSKSGEDKDIIIYDVLGKKVLQTVLTGKELNIKCQKNNITFRF